MRNSLIIIFSYLVVAFAICLGIASFMGHLPVLLPFHKSSFILCRALLFFFRIMPAIIGSGFIVALSIHFGKDANKAQIRFSKTVMGHFKSVMLLSIIFVAIIALVAEVFEPFVKSKKKNYELAPHLLSEYIRLGNECIEEKNYALASRYGLQASRISPLNLEARAIVDTAQGELKAMKSSPVAEGISANEYLPYREVQNETVTSLILKAKAAAEKESWFECHYYASLAATAGTGRDINYEEARRISSLAWNRLQQAPQTEKTRDQILYAKKRSAYKALSEGDNVDAYYQFLEIAAEDESWSSDPDVRQFLEISKKRVEAQCFFIDETDRLESFEAYMNIYFTVKHENGESDVVYIRGITPMKDAGRMIQYLRGVSVNTYGPDGKFIRSMSVPYAKMLSCSVNSFDEETKAAIGIKNSFKNVPYLMLESIDRNQRGKRIGPEYEFGEKVVLTRGHENYLILAMSFEDFNAACDSASGASEMNLYSLISNSGRVKNWGYSPEVYNAVLLRRISFPFVMLIFFLLLATLAWNFRVEDEQIFKFIWVLAVPVCSVIIDVFIQIFQTLAKIGNFALAASLGANSLLVAIILCVVFVFASAILFLFRKTS